MTNEEIVAKIKAGIETADNMLLLWQQCRLFIHSIAIHFQGKAELEDLEQEGYLALYDAVDGFKPEYGYKFITYAGIWINQRIKKYIQNNTLVQIGSLDRYLTDDEDDVTLLDMIASDVDVEVDVLTDEQNKQLKSILWPLVDALPDKQSKVLRDRYQGNKTLREAGESIGATVDQVRNIETKALRSIRYSRHARVLRAFLDDDVYSMGVSGTSANRFKSTWTSATERAAFSLCGETK